MDPLHPERIVPKGLFVGTRQFRRWLVPGSSGASGHFHGFLRDLRTFGVVVSFLSELTFGFALLQLLTRLIGVVVGVVAAIRVRKETRSPPEYVSSSPYGWWP